MYFKVVNQKIDGDEMQGCVIENRTPRFSWAAEHSDDGQRQSAYHIVVKNDSGCKWDTGWIDSQEQSAIYEGEILETGE